MSSSVFSFGQSQKSLKPLKSDDEEKGRIFGVDQEIDNETYPVNRTIS